MNENEDVIAKKDERRQTPDCKSGTTITVGLDSFNVLSYDRYKYSKALDEIRARIPKPSVWISSDVDIDRILQSVGK